MVKYAKEMFVRNGFDGYISNEWDIIACSSIFKEEFKDNEAEKEIILGYANALNCIAESLLKQNHSSNVVMTFRTNSLAIPFIFLARHTVELTLKYTCKLLNIKYKPRHNLIPLWDEIIATFYKYDLLQDDSLDDIKVFIAALEDLDKDGAHSRYSKDNKGILYNDKPKYINVKNINNFIQDFFIKLVNSITIVKNDML